MESLETSMEEDRSVGVDPKPITISDETDYCDLRGVVLAVDSQISFVF